MSRLYFYFAGAIVGIVNGLFGSGGGIIAVPMLNKAGLDTKKSHATSIAVTLPLSVVSCIFYAKNGHLDVMKAVKIIPFGLAGAVLGAIIMKKISGNLLKRIFGIILIVSGIRMFFL